MDETLVGQLKAFGLTEYQSKALATLFTKGEITAKDISDYGNIPETKVYAVLDSLDDLGFIKTTLGRPKKYKAIEPSKIIDSLVEKQKKVVADLEKKKKDIVKDLSDIYNISSDSRSLKKELYVKGDDSWKELAKRTRSMKKSMYLIGDVLTYERGFMEKEYMDAIIEKAYEGKEFMVLFPEELDPSVAIKMDSKTSRDFIKLYMMPNVRIRVTKIPSNLSASIIDEEDVGISIHTDQDVWDALYTRDEKLAKNLIDHFTTLWEGSQEVNKHLVDMIKNRIKGSVKVFN